MTGIELTCRCARSGQGARPAALLLAVLLQCLPFLRGSAVFHGAWHSFGPTAAILLRWVSGGALTLGAMDSVSAASASISGLTLYQNNRPTGKALTNVVTRVGSSFNYRITVLNPGSDHEFDYFLCLPNPPPGLNLNTNVGGSGFITGTPSSAGSYNVKLVAGNTKHATPVTLDAWIQVEPALSPPVILTHPQSLSVLSEQPAQFVVTASGTPPLSYQWFHAGVPLLGATNPLVSFPATAPSQQGQYWVVVSNSVGTVTSSKVVLTVQEPLIAAPVLDQWSASEGGIGFRISGPAGIRHILFGSSNLRDWSAVQTNFPLDGVWRFSELTGPEPRFFRVLAVP